MKCLFPCVLALLLLPLAAGAQPPPPAPDLATTAQAAYDAGDLPAALAAYQALLATYPSPADAPAALHHDLGNTYYRLADLPHAIQHFLAAQRRAPRDPDTAANLRLALQTANVPPPPEPNAWLAPIRRLAPAEWTFVALALYLLAALLCLLYLLLPARLAFRPRLLRPLPFVLLLCVLATAARLTFLLPSYTRLALVDAPGADLLSAPLPDSTPLVHLPAATTVVQTSPAGASYAAVRLPPSTHGYLPLSALLPVP